MSLSERTMFQSPVARRKSVGGVYLDRSSIWLVLFERASAVAPHWRYTLRMVHEAKKTELGPVGVTSTEWM